MFRVYMIRLLGILSLFLDFDYDMDDVFDDGIEFPDTMFSIIFALAVIVIIASTIVIVVRKHKNSNKNIFSTNIAKDFSHKNEKMKEEETFCEYCGGMIPSDKSACPYCGAKRKKK